MRHLPRPTVIDFRAMRWETVKGGGAVGRVKGLPGVKGDTIRVLELDPEWDEDQWCTKKHAGYVISGALNLELAAGSALVARRGEGFYIPRGWPHKASCRKVTKVFLVD